MKYEIIGTSAFKKELKIIKKRHKDLEKLRKVVNVLSSVNSWMKNIAIMV